MVDWLVLWGAAQAAGFVFKPILEDLAKESAKDYTKDFFKDCLKKVIHLPEPNVLKEASGKALKEFLQLVQQELEDADFQAAQIKLYVPPFKLLMEQEAVSAELGRAFQLDCRGLDTGAIALAWENLRSQREGLTLPEGFDWERVSKRYLKKARAIVQESDKLRPIFAAEAEARTAEQVEELVGVAPEFDLGRYAEGIKEQYGAVKLDSLDTTGAYYNELKLWRIFVPQMVRECQEFLPQMYEIPKEHLLRLREAGQVSEADMADLAAAELERQRQFYGEQSVRSVLEVVGDPQENPPSRAEQYAVILGDPGAGKSSLLQYLALVWAERPVRELALHPIPLLIELRSYARDKQEKRCDDIVSFIHGGNVTCRLNQLDLHAKLKAGQAIALFDGIDEIFDPGLRDEVVTDIHRFTNDYPQVRPVVTSRWLGYKAQRLRDAGFRHFMLQDLEPEQVEEFVQQWHELTFAPGAPDKKRKRERLRRAVRESKAIRELAGNPLLLTMMAILNRNQELPRDRPELYLQASRVLLHQWDVERNLIEARLDPLAIDYKDKQAMLRRVAHHMQSSQTGLAGNVISTADLEQILMEYLRSIEVAEPRVTARAMTKQLRERNFILCYLGADSYAFVHRTFLEYFCAWEIVWRFKETQTLSLEALKTEVFGEHWRDESWQEVLCLIAGMIDDRFTGEVIEFLMKLDGEEDKFANLFLAAKCLLEVRNRAEVEECDRRLLERLKELVGYTLDYYDERYRNQETDLTTKIRTQAVAAIASTWQEERSTHDWLKTRAQIDGDRHVRSAVLRELAHGWKNEIDTLPMLKALAQSRSSYLVRVTAVKELARGWQDDLDILLMLKTLVQSEVDRVVRRVAVRELARGWQSDPNILPMLKTLAQSEVDRLLRITAMEELAWGWKDEPGMFEFLCDHALHDPFEREYDFESNPRQTALKAIAQNYPHHPQTLELLRDRAQNDADPQVREFAQEQLAKQEQSST
jgi:predicted NACHT family NTPase